MRKYMKIIRELGIRDLVARRARHEVRRVESHSDALSQWNSARDTFPMVRQPVNYGRGTNGEYFSFKAGGLVTYESAVERDYFTLMEWDYSVGTFAAQPLTVPYELANGRAATYTPDVLAFSCKPFLGKSSIYEPTVYEIKTFEELRRNWEELKPKFKAARRFLGEAGYRFRLLTETGLNHDFLGNIRFLLRFRGPRFIQVTSLESTIIDELTEAAMDLNDEFTPNQILDRVAGRVAPRNQVIPWLWNAYSGYVFQCDMLKPMTMDTRSWRCGHMGHGDPSSFPDWRHPSAEWRR